MKDITLHDCIMKAAENKELIAQYDRLNGTNLSLNGSVIDLMVDKSSGRQKSEIEGFIKFVHDVIYTPIAKEQCDEPSCECRD